MSTKIPIQLFFCSKIQIEKQRARVLVEILKKLSKEGKPYLSGMKKKYCKSIVFKAALWINEQSSKIE